jgi:hypothetical protein
MLPDIITAVKEGRIFAGLHGELQTEYYMRRNPETAIYVALEPRARHPSDINIAVRPDAPNLLQWVNVYLANHVGLFAGTEIVQRYRKHPLSRNKPGDRKSAASRVRLRVRHVRGNHAPALTS